MLVGSVAAAACAVCFGVAAVLQAVAARREEHVHGLDPRLVLRLLRHPVFVLAVALNLAGFVLHVVALRELPLFLAQAVTSASVVVTALLAARVLHVRLDRGAATAVVAVCAGLALLAVAASATGSVQPGTGTKLALLAAVAGLAALGAATSRLPGPGGAALLGLVAGLAFAASALAARVLPGLTPAALATDPAAYTILAAGPLGFLLYSTALQRAAVLTVTAPVLVVQTAAPAAAGVLFLGDEVRPGGTPLALLGLALAVAGSAALSRFDPQVLRSTARRAAGAGGAGPAPRTAGRGGPRAPASPATGSGTVVSGPQRRRRRARRGAAGPTRGGGASAVADTRARILLLSRRGGA